VPCVLEGRIDFVCELSVIGARGFDGETRFYGPFLNEHRDGILDHSTFPAGVPEKTCEEAREIARTILEDLDVVGLVCAELFLDGDGRLLVNEIAPRPHNSGHLTIEGHVTSQFEQHVRTSFGLPLGSTEPLWPASAMANLLGDLWEGGEPDWPALLRDPAARLHLYGKEPRPARKVGHLTVVGEDAAEAKGHALELRERLEMREG
jgi:5-(carboxyamino)imidazole ribonucleotide synthase